ncbi:MAG: UDP-N-acetylglucosamine 2-epimerase (hydrolyzing) [bacterium]|nr:UDP-N-acetylglucosamine 2-epimerase (hydrolyzing) [bacterium]
MEPKKILFISGTRADFGKIKSLMLKLDDDCRFKVQMFVTGMHLLERYGRTVNEIYKVGLKDLFLYINQDANSSSMDMTLAQTIQGLSLYIKESPPDLIVIHGDRVETLAGAIVGALNNILVAHIEGGELSGTIDDLLRHSTSKLAHLHFVANEEAKDRLVQMGEIPESIYTIGSPDIDVMLSEDLPDLQEVRHKYDLPFENYGIFMWHPVTTEVQELQEKTRQVIQGALDSGMEFVVLSPNNDRGTDIILSEIQSSLAGHKRFKHIPSMRFEYFLTLLKNARVIYGNSSAGVREAPVYGTPTINVGTRQNNRYCHKSIINVSENCHDILNCFRQLPKRSERSYYFGDGKSADKFVSILNTEAMWNTQIQKAFLDMKSISHSGGNL